MINGDNISLGGISPEDLSVNFNADVHISSGKAHVSIPLPISVARTGFQPQLTLNYSSSAANSVFGKGWAMGGQSYIGIDLSEGSPRYDQRDAYAFNGSVRLVPTLNQRGSQWEYRISDSSTYKVYYYRARYEQTFHRYEQWIHRETNHVHWRVRDTKNTVSIYGLDSEGRSRIVHPEAEAKVYMWLLEAQYDDAGNTIRYEYSREDNRNIDVSHPYEKRRINRTEEFSQLLLSKILYGNTVPMAAGTPLPEDNSWLFELAFDYGGFTERPYNVSVAANSWKTRPDPFSIYSPGFELRTYRLCRRILLYHNFVELGGVSLTKIFSFYHKESMNGTTLRAMSVTGVRKDLASGTYSEKQLPALTFAYTEPQIENAFTPLVKETNENVPQGFNGSKVRWLDLFGEGLPGLLYESNEAWYFKSNKGGGTFGKQGRLINKPSSLLGTYSLGDFDRNGNLDLFTYNGRTAGYYEYDGTTGNWSGFLPFMQVPNERAVRFIDLNQDGLPDLVVDKGDQLTWYPSKGKEGFYPSLHIAKERANTSVSPTAPIGEDLMLDYFFADMTGDGLPDQVRIMNGLVEYYPNLGNGRFGSLVTMGEPPVFDYDETFDTRRIRLHDITGTGTSDILYLGRGEVSIWYNALGNTFIPGPRLMNLPYIDNLSSAKILDFLGDGTPCLVWSNSLNDYSYSSIQYLRLTNGIRPGLLTSLENAMGKEVQFSYASSARFYLEDHKSGNAWISKLPSHPIVVTEKKVIDHIANTEFVTQYRYRDGHYDGAERSFVGFGLVEQFDAESFENSSIADEKDYASPSCSRIWFHSGTFGWDARKRQHYYQGDTQQSFIPNSQFEDVGALSQTEFESGLRALRGKIVRQEVYGVVNDQREEHPYQIIQTTYNVRRLQPEFRRRDAAFYAYQAEKVTYDYEQNPADPRIAHHLTIEVDDFGNLTKFALLGYSRRVGMPRVTTAQERDLITISEHRYTTTDTPDKYETDTLFESRNFELNRLPKENGELATPTTLRSAFAELIAFDNWLHYDEDFDNETDPQARLTSWERTYFWNDDFTAPLALGLKGAKTLAHHEETAFLPHSMVNLWEGRVTTAMILDAGQGQYIEREGYYWSSAPVNYFLPAASFFTLYQTVRSDNGIMGYSFDAYHLNIIAVTDTLGNRIEAQIDYNLQLPFRLTDPNQNISEVIYDPLGAIIASF